MTVYKSIFRTVLTYGCEILVTTQRSRSKLQAMKMKFLRSVNGLTRLDIWKNEDVRKTLEIESLEDYWEKGRWGTCCEWKR